MKKTIAVLLLAGFLIGGGYVGYTMNWVPQITPNVTEDLSGADPRNTFYEIEGERVELVNGRAETETAPGSASKTVTTYFGNEAMGDLNGDGRTDVAFVLTQESGGSGVFYYAVVAVNTEGGYKGTNAVFLGDRVHPQSTNIFNRELIVNYGERKAGEPMTAEVTVGVSKHLKLDGGMLVPADNAIEWLINDSGAVSEFGAPLTGVGVRVNGAQRGIGTFEGSCFVIEQSEWKLQEGERSGVICWFAGGGTELGIFEEGGKLILKQGVVEEGTAEEPGIRGNFKTLFAL